MASGRRGNRLPGISIQAGHDFLQRERSFRFCPVLGVRVWPFGFGHAAWQSAQVMPSSSAGRSFFVPGATVPGATVPGATWDVRKPCSRQLSRRTAARVSAQVGRLSRCRAVVATARRAWGLSRPASWRLGGIGEACVKARGRWACLGRAAGQAEAVDPPGSGPQGPENGRRGHQGSRSGARSGRVRRLPSTSRAAAAARPASSNARSAPARARVPGLSSASADGRA